jgi:hypothetical protein
LSRKGWKAVERSAAALMGAKRFPANVGARLDFEGPTWVGQVKHVRTLSLAQIEALALEAERLGAQKNPPKLGALVIKRSAGKLAERNALGHQVATPHLIVVSEATWREFTGRLPHDDADPGDTHETF